ncbi:hypothetical protein ACMD2_12844 [Ananas comosus]|uniref:Uncharacterized protein n=1 Tax=Ananas comosus TaxID=4615 RepID=A0A199W8Z1_ANACO|nr:hypothetical protein ACMD2_12844 [Ananas comosus]
MVKGFRVFIGAEGIERAGSYSLHPVHPYDVNRQSLSHERTHDEPDSDWEPRYVRKIRPSDEDIGMTWVGEHDIDSKASDLIARFHERLYEKL